MIKKVFRSELFVKEIVLFLAVQLLGIYVVRKMISAPIGTGFSQSVPAFSYTDILFLLVFLLLFIFMAMRDSTGSRFVLKTFLALAVFSGIQISLGSILDPLMATVLAVVVLAIFLVRSNVLVHDVAMTLALAGIGAVISLSLTPKLATIILALFSFYDIWAVYKTKHMVTMAQGMIRAGAIFGFIIPNKIKDLSTKVKEIVPGDRFMILGSGDIALPLILSGSVARISLMGGLIIAVFSAIGLLITHVIFVSQTERRPMAALPPIASMTILGYLLFIFLS